MNKPVLYSYFRSSCSYRVRIVLNYLEQAYDYHAIHLLNNGGEQYSEEYKKLNPMSQVPYYVDSDIKLSQSMAIIEYLSSKNPDKAIFGNSISTAGKIREFCEHINTGIQPIQNLKILQLLVQKYNFTEDQKIEWIQTAITDGFQAIEKLISEDNPKFCFQKFSAADAFLIPQIYNAARFSVDMTAFPKLNSVNSHCLELAYFQKAHPDQQPDKA